jgi:hypothetical protein
MARTLTISVPEADYDFYRYAWEQLAEEVITDDEAGQRGTKRSVMFQMICTAGIANFGRAVELLTEVKQLTTK